MNDLSDRLDDGYSQTICSFNKPSLLRLLGSPVRLVRVPPRDSD